MTPSELVIGTDSRTTKTSHKAAEQKRRDSLKAGFDELRMLLPPITNDPDPDEPALPGSAPPRGPQRNQNLPPGSEDHPNRGVSKLALLRSSNEFIGRLIKRIERRDGEIDKLRDEVRFLRQRLGVDENLGSTVTQSEESITEIVPMTALASTSLLSEQDMERVWVDLARDLDEVEKEIEEIKSSKRLAIVPEDNESPSPTQPGPTPAKTGGRKTRKDASAD